MAVTRSGGLTRRATRARRRRAGSFRRPLAGLLADRGYLVAHRAAPAAAALAGIGYLIWTTVAETGDVWSTFGVWGFLTGDRVDPRARSTAPRSSAPSRSSTARS